MSTAPNWYQCFEECLCGCNDKLERPRAASSIRVYSYSLKWLAERIDGFGTGPGAKIQIPPAEEIVKYMEENNIALKRRQNSYSAMKVIHNALGNKAESKKFGIPLVETKRARKRPNGQTHNFSSAQAERHRWRNDILWDTQKAPLY